jgi:hypothetical protein
MVSLTSERSSWLPTVREHWQNPLARRDEPRLPPTKLVVAGAVVLGLGVLAWYYLGPDVRRYLKIQKM